MTSFEQAFAETERAASASVTASATLLRAAKEVAKAAHEGDINKLRKAAEKLGAASLAARQLAANAQAAWPMTPDEEENTLRETFAEELIEAASAQGLSIRRQDDRLAVFPSLIRIRPGRRDVEIDKKAVTAIRPSRLVAILKLQAEKKPRYSPDKFVEVLHDAYRLVIGNGPGSSGTTLGKVYEALTIMPDVRKEYTGADFGRELFFLDRSGLTQTKSGARLSFPTATGTKGGGTVFSFVAPDGEIVSYYGIRFE
jgi:hypothetical protein